MTAVGKAHPLTAVVTALNQLDNQMFVDQTPVILGQGRNHT